MASDGAVVFSTELDTSGLKSGLSALETTIGKMAKGIGVALGTISAGLTYGGKKILDVGSNFDSAMTQVAATMGTTVGEIGILTEAAQEMGRTTQFSATEAAEALNYLALAGYDAEKSAKTLPAVLNLAAAGGMDLAYASDMVTDSMSALGLGTEDVVTFSDQMAKTASKSNTSVSQLGEAILTVGGTAKSLAGGTIELNTALGLLADNGIKGSEGGTKLRNMILSLSAPTTAAKKKMDEMGISVFDASGNMRSLEEIFSDLNESMATLSAEEQTNALNTIFNKTDLKAAQALLGTSAERWEELTTAIQNSSGASAEMAATMLDNLEGDKTIFKSAGEGLMLALYEGMQGPARSIVQYGTEIIGRLTEGFESGGTDGLIRALGSSLSEAMEKSVSALPNILDIAKNVLESIAKAMTRNSKSLASGLSTALLAAVKSITSSGKNLLNAAISIGTALMSGMADQLPELVPSVVDAFVGIFVSLCENADDIIRAGVAIAGGLIKGILSALPTLAQGIWNGFMALFTNVDEIANRSAEILEEQFGDSLTAYETFKKGIAQADETFDSSLADIEARKTLALELMEEYKRLGNQDVRTDSDIQRMLEIAKQLTELFPELQNYIDPTTGSFIEGAEAVEAYIISLSALAKMNAYQDYLSELYKLQVQAELDYTKAAKAAEAINTSLATSKDRLKSALALYEDFTLSDATTALENNLNTLREVFSGTAYESEFQYNLDNYYNRGHDTLTEQLGQIIVDLEGETTSWETAQAEAAKTVEEMEQGILKNQSKIDEINAIIKEGFDAPETPAENTVTNAINDDLDSAKSTLENGKTELSELGTQSAESYAEGIDQGAQAVTNSAEGMKNDALEAARATSAEAVGIGAQIPSGMALGVSINSGVFAAAMRSMVAGGLAAAQAAAQIHSPSGLFRDEVGAYLPAGAAQGVDQNAWMLRQSIDNMITGALPDSPNQIASNLASGWGIESGRRYASQIAPPQSMDTAGLAAIVATAVRDGMSGISVNMDGMRVGDLVTERVSRNIEEAAWAGRYI